MTADPRVGCRVGSSGTPAKNNIIKQAFNCIYMSVTKRVASRNLSINPYGVKSEVLSALFTNTSNICSIKYVSLYI